MNALERHLTELRRQLARLPEWSDAWMVAWLQETHLEAEALRREAGWSCGCSLCQAFPKGQEAVAKSPGRPNHRPRVLRPQDKALIRQLGREGRGARAISRELGAQGIRVSLRTIGRRLRELRP